jgi:putative glutamine amidotransferase
VDKLGAGLVVSAKSVKDGIIEGLEVPGKEFAVGVQWHPEDQVPGNETQVQLFRAFADAVSARDIATR